jgi:hypothetical protein
LSIAPQNASPTLYILAILTLGSQPRQGFTKVRAKYETRESHFMLPGVQESVREWTLTLSSELSLWELESQWTPEFLNNNYRGQNPSDGRVPYIIGKVLERRCLKWARMTHLKLNTQVIIKRKVGSQIDNLTPNH